MHRSAHDVLALCQRTPRPQTPDITITPPSPLYRHRRPTFQNSGKIRQTRETLTRCATSLTSHSHKPCITTRSTPRTDSGRRTTNERRRRRTTQHPNTPRHYAATPNTPAHAKHASACSRHPSKGRLLLATNDRRRDDATTPRVYL